MVASTAKVARANPPKKSPAAFKKPSKPNASILSFFQKTQKQEDSLFVGPGSEIAVVEDDIYGSQSSRFNESESPIKKRRVCQEQLPSTHPHHSPKSTAEPIIKSSADGDKSRVRSSLPFLIDSDSEEEGEAKDTIHDQTAPISHDNGTNPAPASSATTITPPLDTPSTELKIEPCADEDICILPRQDSCQDQIDPAAETGYHDDLDLDDFEGEELRERRFMWEQARLEAEEEGSLFGEDFPDEPPDDSTMVTACPICSESLAGVSTDDAARHVNSCLDGNPTPLPQKDLGTKEKDPGVKAEVSGSSPPLVDSADMSKRFARAAVPRPAQADPFGLASLEPGGNTKASKSTFSKLMSNNAEDSAWATAAAAEHASRGRPAYERTCPFYKIMPGFNICVDAFRYGAVQGCEAYFLSHFHSDHYIGLTANWRHGPIYCSKVTGGLVKQQLRTAAKWVVELEFNQSYDVPGTGATVTMIPANHCPGSSLFLFEKPIGSGPKPNVRRILHCGDFRACPEHVGHALLKPTLLDSITGKERQQTIHMCYLDTTYLNPRYSFPPQEQVIRACADICASISADPDCKDDVWEQSVEASGTRTVSTYFQPSKTEDDVEIKSEQLGTKSNRKLGQRLLVVCGTYSIGKERICVAIAKALKSKIYVTPGKMRICKQLRDPELEALLTSKPLEAQVHMQSLMEIRAETLKDYLAGYKPHFSRIVGFRPSGWTFRQSGNGGGSSSKAVGANTPPSSVPTTQILHGKGWKTSFGYRDLVAQRGSSKEAMCFGVPYSEHSSFRELAMFVMSLRIEKVIPTVNVGSEQSRKRMKGWIDKWMAERRKCGLVRPLSAGEEEKGCENKVELWDGKTARGGGVWW